MGDPAGVHLLGSRHLVRAGGDRLEKVNADYSQRLENLEAVVASQSGSLLRQQGPVATAPHEIEEMNTQRVAHLARRLGG